MSALYWLFFFLSFFFEGGKGFWGKVVWNLGSFLASSVFYVKAYTTMPSLFDTDLKKYIFRFILCWWWSLRSFLIPNTHMAPHTFHNSRHPLVTSQGTRHTHSTQIYTQIEHSYIWKQIFKNVKFKCLYYPTIVEIEQYRY